MRSEEKANPVTSTSDRIAQTLAQWRQEESDSGIESEAEREFWDSYLGLKPPQLDGLRIQHKVPPYRLDFAIPDKKIGIEIDGYEYHSDRRSFTLDRERQRDLELRGWRIIRFSGEEACRRPDECVLDSARLVTVFQKGIRR
jgi:very-short-patch-repair endonuclease